MKFQDSKARRMPWTWQTPVSGVGRLVNMPSSVRLKKVSSWFQKRKNNYRMTLSEDDPPRKWNSARLNERVQLWGTPSNTSCLHRELSRRGRVKMGELKNDLEGCTTDINPRLRIAKASNSMSKEQWARSCVLSQRWSFLVCYFGLATRCKTMSSFWCARVER